uniref:Uncharacterized protein n=1 Tax=Macrostomum lignano TaxID=282301 RepID=A0A1I8FWF9_9PLAT
MARSLFKDHHVLLIVKRRNGRNTKSCASPEVLPLLHSNDANGLLQQFELLSSQEPSGNSVSTRKPTADEMRKEVRAEARAAYTKRTSFASSIRHTPRPSVPSRA